MIFYVDIMKKEIYPNPLSLISCIHTFTPSHLHPLRGWVLGSMPPRALRMVVLDLCGTLSRDVCRFDVASHMQASRLCEHMTEAEYWKMVSATWGTCSTQQTSFREAALQWMRAHTDTASAPSGPPDTALDVFLARYWSAHTIDADWTELLAHRTVLLAVSAQVGHAKKERAFWDALLQFPAPDGVDTVTVVATDHYEEAEAVLRTVLPPSCTVMTLGAGGGGGGGCGVLHDHVTDVILVDDFGCAEQQASGYAERRLATEAVVREALPPAAHLHTVAVTPDVSTAHYKQRVLELLQ